MSLSERLKIKSVKTITVTVDGDTYVVTGMSKLHRGRQFAKARKKDGSVDSGKLESLLLAECVAAEDGSKATAEEWDFAPAHITSPLVAAVMEVCGLDKQDVGESDPKDSGSTES